MDDLIENVIRDVFLDTLDKKAIEEKVAKAVKKIPQRVFDERVSDTMEELLSAIFESDVFFDKVRKAVEKPLTEKIVATLKF